MEDAEAEVAELKARGVVFEEYDAPGLRAVNSIATGDGAKTARFEHSEGNIWRSASGSESGVTSPSCASPVCRIASIASGILPEIL